MDDEILKALAAITERLSQIEGAIISGALSVPVRAGDGMKGDGSKYPWSKLETDGKFFYPCVPKEKTRVQASISANAIKRFGKGAVRVRQVKGGVWVFLKKPLAPIDTIPAIP